MTNAEPIPLWAMELAAQCWCDEETKTIVMDSRLAIAFAKRLVEQQIAQEGKKK